MSEENKQTIEQEAEQEAKQAVEQEAEQEAAPKKEKKNKGTRFLVDYYKVNREITKEYDKIYEEERKEREKTGEKKKWTNHEKFYVVVIALGVIGLLVKYVIL